MSGFTLCLQGAVRSERLDGVTRFIGTDASGSFGILPGRARFMTLLEYGLCRFQVADGGWLYLACPGAVLSFADDRLELSTRRYLYDADYQCICAGLAGQLAEEENALRSVKENLQKLEQALLRRLRTLDRWGG